MVKSIYYTPIHLSLEEVAGHTGHTVLVKVDDNSALIIGNLWGILGWQLWSQPIHFLNNITTLIIY